MSLLSQVQPYLKQLINGALEEVLQLVSDVFLAVHIAYAQVLHLSEFASVDGALIVGGDYQHWDRRELSAVLVRDALSGKLALSLIDEIGVYHQLEVACTVQ